MPIGYDSTNSIPARGPDGIWYDVKLRRTGINDDVPRAGGSAVGLLWMAGVVGWRTVRWMRRGRPWTVRVERYPTLKGDDQVPSVIHSSDHPNRAHAANAAETARKDITQGHPLH